VACFVITSSDTRTEATDESGRLIRELLGQAGHPVAGHLLVKDEPGALRAAIETASNAGARAVIISGGTGISRRDTAVETVLSLVEKRLDGFGELFRMLSYEEIGSAAMLSRAVAGCHRGMLVFALPGSAAAARLALTKLILPELGHAVREITR
jgi:molybdenum cofactor biosynthesis protein B